jgi:hypothetical protein
MHRKNRNKRRMRKKLEPADEIEYHEADTAEIMHSDRETQCNAYQPSCLSDCDGKIIVIQHGTDGMGHQLHGLLSCLALHNVDNYYFDGYTFINKPFSFQHLNKKSQIYVKEYFIEIVKSFIKDNNQGPINYKKIIHSHEVYKIPKNYTSDTVYSLDNCYYFDKIPISKSNYEKYVTNIEKIKSLFINEKLPQNRLNENNVVIHLRQGDAITCGRGDVIGEYNKKIIKILPKMINNFKDYTFYIHTDGNPEFVTNILSEHNVDFIVHSKTENILNVLSDFIYSNVFLTGISGLSTVCTFLGNHKLTVVSDDIVHSLPDNVVRISDYEKLIS